MFLSKYPLDFNEDIMFRLYLEEKNKLCFLSFLLLKIEVFTVCRKTGVLVYFYNEVEYKIKVKTGSVAVERNWCLM